MVSLTFAERTLQPVGYAFGDYLHGDDRRRRGLVVEARRAQVLHRRERGYDAAARVLTLPESQPKLHKSQRFSVGLTLSPSRLAQPVEGVVFNLCPAASAGCEAACLNTAGKGSLDSVQLARVARTAFALTDPYAFGVLWAHELSLLLRRHRSLLLRPNVDSDVRWEWVMGDAVVLTQRLGITWYDYTAWSPKHRPSSAYDITYSIKETHTVAQIDALLSAGERIAVVFDADKPTIRQAVADGLRWRGHPLVDGVSTDDRSMDPRPSVVALSALGRAKQDASGFVRSSAEWHR